MKCEDCNEEMEVELKTTVTPGHIIIDVQSCMFCKQAIFIISNEIMGTNIMRFDWEFQD